MRYERRVDTDGEHSLLKLAKPLIFKLTLIAVTPAIYLTIPHMGEKMDTLCKMTSRWGSSEYPSSRFLFPLC